MPKSECRTVRLIERAQFHAKLLRDTAALVEEIAASNNKVAFELNQLYALLGAEGAAKLSSLLGAPKYAILEGTPYSRYAIPIEYPPSRDWQPRWGYSRSREPILDQWFRAHIEDYRQFIGRMRHNAPILANVPRIFDEANLPQPAWGECHTHHLTPSPSIRWSNLTSRSSI